MTAFHRPLITALAVAAAAVTTALPWQAARAEAAMAKSQAPGWYRMKVGAFEVTALSDGTVSLPVDKLLSGNKPEVINGLLARAHLKAPVETSVNGYLVNTGSKLVLIDAGAAGLFGPTLGKLVANLKAAGYTPDQVDEIYITHMHPDHVGGLVASGQMVFPKAIVRADVREGGFWLNPENLDKAPADAKGFFQGAMASLNPYVAAGKLQPFDGATELVPGIRAVPAVGHTPGHTIYLAESEGSRIVFWGDLLHVAAVQFSWPSTTIAFDSDSRAAAPARMKNLADAARQGYFVALAHVSFPGIGQVRANGKGYLWLPANYVSAP
jgi:glyoxylase-like metal-dependent hydrolase (beta-lactamase superfamily II)